MTMNYLRLTLLAFGVLTVGCASNFGYVEPVIQAGTEQGVIVLYQNKKLLSPLGIGGPKIYLNNQGHGELSPGKYLKFPLDAGDYVIEAKGHFLWDVPDQKIFVQLAPGEIKYIRYHWGIHEMIPPYFASREGGLYELPRDFAEQELIDKSNYSPTFW